MFSLLILLVLHKVLQNSKHYSIKYFGVHNFAFKDGEEGFTRFVLQTNEFFMVKTKIVLPPFRKKNPMSFRVIQFWEKALYFLS